MNIPLLTKNLATTPVGADPALDIITDLAHKRGHTLNYLVHLFGLSFGGITVGVDSAASITDESTGWYGVQHGFHPIFRVNVRSDRLLVKTPHSSLSGTLDELHVRAQTKGVSIDVTLKAVGHPLYNKGTGRFDMLGMDVYQYSIPTLETTGRLSIDRREFPASGVSWFDRQWQKQALGPPRGRWTWTDLNLSNGWRISLWDATVVDGNSTAWVTLVDESGKHVVADLVPLNEDACDYWLSPQSGSLFPTRWRVLVHALDMQLEVTRSRASRRSEGCTRATRARVRSAATATSRWSTTGKPE